MAQKKSAAAIADVEGALDAAERLERKGRQVDALAAALVVLIERPEHGRAALIAGRCLLAMSRPAEAVSHLRRAALVLPGEAKPLCHLGEACAAAGLDREALDAYARATQANAELAWGWLGHGATAQKLGLHADAERSLSEALELRPDLAEAFLLRGFARCGLGRMDEARADLDRALRLDPELRRRLDEAPGGRA
jgi:protein O-GlcNAc transferase